MRDVRAHQRTNRATEPNVQSQDRKLRAHREVRLPDEGSSSASDRLQEFAQRSRADIADAPPLLAADVTMADVPQLPASAVPMPMPTGRVTESGIVSTFSTFSSLESRTRNLRPPVLCTFSTGSGEFEVS